MPCIHRDHSPTPHHALSPLCILIVLLLSLCCSSSTRRSREHCAGARHYAGPVTPCFPKTIRPCSAAAQEGGHSGQRLSALPTAGEDNTCQGTHPSPTPSALMALPPQPYPGLGGSGGQQGLPEHSTDGFCLPARSCPSSVTPSMRVPIN